MAIEWKDALEKELVRDPLVEFVLNGMRRFTTADLGLSLEDTDGPLAYDAQWWQALVSVARDGDRTLSINQLLERAETVTPGSLLIPGEYSLAFRDRTDLDVITVYARRDYLNAVNALDGEDTLGISSALIAGPLDPGTLSIPSTPFLPDESEIEATNNTVVTAVIDYGIAIAHDLFRRNENDALWRSRVEFFFDMDGTPDASAKVQSTVGRIWTRKEIEEILKKHLHNGLLDEAEVYRELGLINWRTKSHNSCAHRLSHGTHVTGLAAGYKASDPTGADRPIIAVQLPTRFVVNTIGQWFGVALEQAFLFISQCMKRYKVVGTGADVPLVMNFSFGSNLGPHDGTGAIDRAIDTALTDMESDAESPRVLMLPTGNGNLSRCHAVLNLTEAAPTAEIDWMLQPDDRSASLFTVWLPRMTPVPEDAVTLEINVPGSTAPKTIKAGMTLQITYLWDTSVPGSSKYIGLLAYVPPEDPVLRGRFHVFATPTSHPKDSAPYAPFGAWGLKFQKGNMVENLTLNGWVQRDETLPGFAQFGRQPYIDGRAYSKFDHPSGAPISDDPAGYDGVVRRAGMINGIACGNLPGVIAGYVRSDGRMADYSAGGPTHNPNRLTGPDCAAVSDDSVVLSGVLSAGSSSGSLVPMNGTSVATPQMARWAVDKIATSPTTAFDRADLFAKGLADDPATPQKPRAQRTGGGRVKLGSEFGTLRWSSQ
jgi:hypothetical protein